MTESLHIAYIAFISRDTKVRRHFISNGVLQNRMDADPMLFRKLANRPNNPQGIRERNAYVMRANVIHVQIQVALCGERINECLLIGNPNNISDNRIGSGETASTRTRIGARAQVGGCDGNRIATATSASQQVSVGDDVGSNIDGKRSIKLTL